MPLETPHKDYYYGYGQQNYAGPGYGYHQGPYVYDMDNRQPLPAIQYGPEQAGSTWKWA